MFTRRPSAPGDSEHAEPAELVPEGLALDYAHGWGTLAWRMVKRENEEGGGGPGGGPPGKGPGDQEQGPRPAARPRSVVRKISRTFSGAGSPRSRPRFTACQVAISIHGKDSIVNRNIKYDSEAKEHKFAASIELGRPGACRICVRLHDELRKDWTPWSESLDGEAVEQQNKAVRKRPQLDRPHPHLPRNYYRGKLQGLRERKLREGWEFSRVRSLRSSHDPLGDISNRCAPLCLHVAHSTVPTH